MEEQRKKSSDWLIDVFSEFSRGEPTAIAVIFTDENGDLVIKTQERRIVVIGLLEAAKNLILNDYDRDLSNEQEPT